MTPPDRSMRPLEADLSANDRRVLRAIERAAREWDGYFPHGTQDWTAIRRLISRGLVECTGTGACCECDNPKHNEVQAEGPIYVLTADGKAALL